MSFKKPPSQSDTLDSRFELDEVFLSSPSAAALKSAVIGATDRQTGDPVVLKYWQKAAAPVDADLRELWRHEMRQNARVRTFPRADEVVVEILASGECDDAFYAVMPADIAPLEHAMRVVRPDHWLRALRGSRQRILLWGNMRRLAEAVGAVHRQGLVHGRIDARAVYTAGAATLPDFRLGGFEFCLGVAKIAEAPLHVITRSRLTGSIVFSFLDDWLALGRVAADLLGLDVGTLGEQEFRFIDGISPTDLLPSEIDLLRMLFEPDRNRILEAVTVTRRMDAVLRELEAESRHDGGRYVLAFRLGRASRHSILLNQASGDAFDADDVDGQIEFIRADLETGARLVRTVGGDLLLMTESLVYDLQPLATIGVEETWNTAVCRNMRLRGDVHLGRVTEADIEPHRIEVVRFVAAAPRLRALRSDALDWSAALVASVNDDPTAAVRRGLLLVQVAEALFKAAEIVPVELVAQRRQGERRLVELAASESQIHLRLSNALKVDEPIRLMRRLFDHEEADVDAEWQLTEAAGLGASLRSTAKVRYVRPSHRLNRRIYEFEVLDGALPPSPQLHLRKIDDAGTEQALRRRLRMLATLATQTELAQTLADPRARLRGFDDALIEDEHFEKLDASKQDALRSIWSAGPTQLVVGPPGVGKTRLVTEIVRRVLEGDPTTKLLLSAQAHQALDHLAASIQDVLSEAGLSDGVILVRSKADNGAELSGAQTPERAEAYLRALVDSPLCQRGPLTIRQGLAHMTSVATMTGDIRSKLPLATLRQRRSFEALVLQSANLLFSTTNSGDLARLVEDGAQFDWLIVEEAAKATGPELLAPQLLSMRRLLIGDHNQLPPFDTDRLATILEDQTRTKQALLEGESLIGNVFRDHGLDDLREAIEDDRILSETCAIARRMLLFFESTVNDQLDRQRRFDRPRARTATELLQQHRMHPAIAEVVSQCFYGGTLETSAESRAAFSRGRPPFEIIDDRLTASPIVFVDLTYVQRGGAAGEQRPTYHNPSELQAVMAVLGMLRAEPGKSPSLAVLSPYNEQVARLGRAIDDASQSSLTNLAGFYHAANASGFQSTVDSFQGSEADVVIVSLVRNNDHVGRAALGILRDRRRMNVLMSRAKWKLVIVGSMEFLRVHGRQYRRRAKDTPGAPVFLSSMVDVFARLEGEMLDDGTTPKFSRVPWTSLAGSAGV